MEGVELQKVNRFYFDENRKAVIELEEGTNQVIPVEYVIFAVGQKPEDTEQMGLALTHGPYILADENQRTSQEGVYAAGDAVTGTKSVIEAIAAGPVSYTHLYGDPEKLKLVQERLRKYKDKQFKGI